MPIPRKSAEERRAEILEAAMPLIAERGFDGTPTLAIAQAAGISHAYLFRLFPAKEDLNVAVVARCNRIIRERFAHAAEEARARGEDPGPAMGAAYAELLRERDTVLVQLHAHAASPTHPEIREAMRASFADLHGVVERATGAEPEAIRAFFAEGMLMNVAVALDLGGLDAPWARALAPVAEPAGDAPCAPPAGDPTTPPAPAVRPEDAPGP
jgi:AcrR family transcriptional regulator